MRYPLTPTSISPNLKTDNDSDSESVEQVELSYITDGRVKWYSHFGKLFDSFL